MNEDNPAVNVEVYRTGLLAVQTGDTHDTRYPVIGLWTNILDFEEEVYTSRQCSGLPIYQIVDIKDDNEDGFTTSVTISFAREDPESGEYSNVFTAQIPIQYLTAMQVMRMSDHSCYPAVLDDRHSIVYPDRKVTLDDILFGIFMPDVETIESDELSEKMTTMVAHEYTEPFAPLGDEDDMSDGALPLSHRKAQAYLFTLLSGLSQGDVISFQRLITMETWLNTHFERYGPHGSDPDMDEASDHDIFVDNIVQLLHMLVVKSNISVNDETDQEIDTNIKASISPLGETEHDREFVNIMSGTDIGDSLRKISAESRDKGAELLRYNAQASTVRTPFVDGWPSSMLAIKQEIDNNPELRDRHPLWESAIFSNLEQAEEEINKYPYAEVITASALLIAARALRVTEVIRVNQEISTTIKPYAALQLTMWLNLNSDTTSWELLAPSSLLASYETSQFTDVLASNLSYDDNVDSAVHLQCVLHTIAHQLEKEEWTVSSFQSQFDKLNVMFPDVRQVGSYIVNDVVENAELNNDGDPETPCAAGAAVTSLTHSGLTLETLAAATATLIPVMADLQAERNKLPLGEEEWNQFRSSYIRELLTNAHKTFMRNFGSGE